MEYLEECKMENSKKMSVTQLIIITAVNMMGSGIIMLPSKLAQVGGLSIVSWLVTAVGSMLLAYAFAKCGMYSKNPGGIVVMLNIHLARAVTSFMAILLTAYLLLLRMLLLLFLL